MYSQRINAKLRLIQMKMADEMDVFNGIFQIHHYAYQRNKSVPTVLVPIFRNHDFGIGWFTFEGPLLSQSSHNFRSLFLS